MNHNHLRKRRVPGPEDDSSIVPGHHSSSPSPYANIHFSTLHPETQILINQVADLYNIPGFRLHQILSNTSQIENAHKRQRLASGYSMSSQYAGGSLPEDYEEKAPHIGQHALANVELNRSSGFPGPVVNGLTQGMQTLALAFCQNCWSTCAVTNDGYQPLPGSEVATYDYGTNSNRPYEVEKPPSAQVSQSDVYVPTPVVSNTQNSFPAGGNNLLDSYVSSYQPVHEDPNQTLVSQHSGPDTDVYVTEVSAPSFYSTIPSGHVGGEPSYSNANTLDRRLTPRETLPPTYGGNMMDMVISPALHTPTPVPVTTARFAMDSTYPMSCVKTEDMDGSIANTHANASLDVVFPNQRPPAAKRGPFKDQKAREETAATRKNGSCIRCKMQRVRCKTDPDDPKGPCLGCKPRSNNNHHKQLIRQPCVRHKITECHFFKKGQAPGFEWTQRFNNGIVDNINNWASNEVRIVRLWEGYTPSSMWVQLSVREFVPQPGDKLERTWVTEEGEKKSVAIPTYAITNLDDAQTAYEDYIKRGVVECFNSVVESVMGVRDRLLFETYLKAWKLSQDPSTAQDEKELLLQTLELWMAVRLTTKSIEIVGDDTLGMTRDILDSSSPQHGRIPLPPVMGAQLDLVLIQHIQTRLRREMLEKLQKMTLQNKQKTWLTTYLVTFMLLHNIALVTDHDASYARKHGMKTKFARQTDVQEYHMGGTILLAYFHYCNKGIYPFSEDCRDQDLRTLAQLDDDAVQFIHYTRAMAMQNKREWEEVQRANQYEQPYFFVSQLFQRDWQPQTWAY
ncbi:hypothetical protein HER10_EVM0003810 [Colletotrichum scovillei]|uniref:Tetratricopeptide repeat domain containing protein n=1 Tax=Colletotrichum scovillei TaxID=1209932 RepID=A0A9P7QWP9_9PEZI|nr:uncharacterized protein HER10_EVM0003810 [Colletotrichum scovillei]KAF4774829.1 hypothetical protein HER10_EVM0003810 [Colletotrichum scovillei]KAG7042980.1 tetratricopeptide repeat domain containing protein [Colletotrichum scovillei]KAG7043575.1 tetratricopeptide repeat domain containing protein [Colletotrichum scovillei]KAG7063026.1 tetratricopeptide repeat domain containing protein [Colletotrichum scovillei]